MFNQNVLSIEPGSKNIKIIEGRHNRNNVFIEKAIMIPTPKDSINDGKIIDRDKIRDILQKTIKENKIKSKKVIFTTKSTSIISREIEMPFAKQEELESMVKFEIQQYLPIMLDDYIVEFKILDEFKEDNQKKLRLLVVVMPKGIAEEYIKLVRELKLKPLALDVNSNSVSKLFNKNLKINNENYSFDKTVSIIDFGHEYLNVNVVSEGNSLFSRIIQQGGKDIDISLANSFNFTMEEAENKKINECKIIKVNSDYIETSMMNEILNGTIDAFIMEIKRVFQYYESRERGNKINKMYIYGGTSKLNGLIEYLSEAFSIPVLEINDLNNVKFSKSFSQIEIHRYLNTIGAIIRK